MIVDRLENHTLYSGLSDDIKNGLDHLAGLDGEIQMGRYELSERAFVIVSAYETGTPPFAGYEAHRKHIDIQYPYKGKECVMWSALQGMDVSEPYNPDIDRGIWEKPVQQTSVVIGDGVFAIFFPEDAHRPCLPTPEGKEKILKVTIKISI